MILLKTDYIHKHFRVFLLLCFVFFRILNVFFEYFTLDLPKYKLDQIYNQRTFAKIKFQSFLLLQKVMIDTKIILNKTHTYCKINTIIASLRI